MDEYKPTARQLVTIKGLHIFNLKQYCLHGKYSHLIPIAHLNKEWEQQKLQEPQILIWD